MLDLIRIFFLCRIKLFCQIWQKEKTKRKEELIIYLAFTVILKFKIF